MKKNAMIGAGLIAGALSAGLLVPAIAAANPGPPAPNPGGGSSDIVMVPSLQSQPVGTGTIVVAPQQQGPTVLVDPNAIALGDMKPTAAPHQAPPVQAPPPPPAVVPTTPVRPGLDTLFGDDPDGVFDVPLPR